MARIQTLTVSKGRTVNIGNYNSAQFRYGITFEMEEGDSYSSVYKEAEKIVDGWIDEEHSKWEKE